MAATAVAQSNTTNGRGLYFIGIDRRLCTSSLTLTASARFQSGLLAVTSKFDDDGNKINTMTRQEIKDKIGISPATASRNNKRLNNCGTIEKSGVSTYVYKEDVIEGEEIKKWYCPTELLTEPFPSKDDDGNDIIINFTYSDGLVYAYYYTLLPHTGENKRTLKAAFDEIAETLCIDASTVAVAVRKLRQAGLIHFPNGWCGKNRYKKSRVQLKRGFSWFKREREYRALLAAKKEAGKSKTEPTTDTPKTTSTNAATARKLYYSTVQTEKEKKAAQALSEAINNKDYRRLNDELADAKFKYNNAIIHNDAASQKDIAVKLKGIEKMQASVLKNIGIEPAELLPEYYVVCAECNDTGVKSDGTACDCWKKRRQGSPPKNGKRTTKGIE